MLNFLQMDSNISSGSGTYYRSGFQSRPMMIQLNLFLVARTRQRHWHLSFHGYSPWSRRAPSQSSAVPDPRATKDLGSPWTYSHMFLLLYRPYRNVDFSSRRDLWPRRTWCRDPRCRWQRRSGHNAQRVRVEDSYWTKLKRQRSWNGWVLLI